VRRLWALARNVPAADRTRPCPICTQAMATVPTLALARSEPLRLDLCTGCQFVWFDPSEHEAWLQSSSFAVSEDRLPAETRAALARLPPAEQPLTFQPDVPVKAPFFELVEAGESLELKYLICVLGYPVEVEGPPLQRRPWLTWTLIALVTAISSYALLFVPAAPQAWGVIPAELWRQGGLTLLTSFFLHGSPLHLLGNMYFLAVFGDNVEDLLGSARYLVLLLAATVAGDLVQAGMHPSSRIPGIGASAGIAGVIVYYGLTFPHGRVRLFRIRFFDLSVWGALVLWVGLQIVGALGPGASGPGVAYAAHLGGALAGAAFWLLSRIGAGRFLFTRVSRAA
jgi:membrane associated rhomboid family serine protease